MNLCVTVEGSPRVNALPSSSSSTWPEMSNKINPVSLLPHLVYPLLFQRFLLENNFVVRARGQHSRNLIRHCCFKDRRE